MAFNFFPHFKAPGNRKERGRKSFQRVKSRRLRFESLESRQLLSAGASTTLSFNIPADVASQGVYAGLYSNKSECYLDPGTGDFASFSQLSDSVPLFTLASPTQDQQAASDTPVSYQLTIPLTQDVVSGELFIFVGQPTTGLAYSDNSVAAPKAAASPATDTPGDNFAQFEFDYEAAKGLDIDISAVDSTGFPFALVYPSSAGLSYPLTTLGITLNQADLNHDFEAAFSAGGEYEDHREFEQCATYATQLNPSDLQVVAPQDILASEVAAPQFNAPVLNTDDMDSHLTANCNYYYRLTAFSNNEIDNSGGVLGETLLSDTVNVAASSMVANTSVTLSWNQYYDPNTAGYNIYRYSSTDGTAPTDSTVYSLIAHLYGATTTRYTDEGAIPQAKQTSVATATNYGFNPLSEYYTAEIKAFFDHYTTPNSFAITSNGALWVGNTATYTPSASWNTTGATYTVLQLTAQNSVESKSIEKGDVINIYQPFFATNTSYLGTEMPVMPNWMRANSDPHESPSQMVFACDTVFASNKYDPDVAGNSDLATALGAVENCIVSAFNRGVATCYEIQPDNWAAFPQMLSAPVVADDSASQVTDTTTYYYAVTAVNTYGETTPSLEVSATLAKGQSATLNWANGANAVPAIAYRIYRGTTTDDLRFLCTVGGQETSYTDEGAESSGGWALPFEYFTVWTTSNWYAAFVQSNSTIDPVNGVSINGLSYGFPYSDQGGVSTNICFAPDNIPENITVNLGTASGPSFVTQSLPDAIVGTAYEQTLVVGGSGTGTQFSVVGSDLPSWLSLDSDTGVLSGTPTSTAEAVTFNVQASNSAGSVVMPFSLTVDASSQTPLSLAGSSNGTLTLGATDVGKSFSMRVLITGGSGSYTMTLASDYVLPTGMVISGLETGLSSESGIITLTGSTTSSFTPDNVGILVTVTDNDPKIASSITPTLYIEVNPSLEITTSSLVAAVQGEAYCQTLTTNNFSSGVRFEVTSGKLPTGMTLTRWGVLSGTPTEHGTFSFTVTARDIADGTATHTFDSFQVETAAPSPITFTTTSLPVTAPTADCDKSILVTGGHGTLVVALVNGALPDGLSLSTPTDGAAYITGVVSAAPGVYSFTLRAIDSLGNATYQAYQMVVNGVTTNTQNLAANATTLVIHGYGFDTETPSNNVVTLSSGAVQSVAAPSSTELLVTLEPSITPLTAGILNATVATDGLQSTTAQVATVVGTSTLTVTANADALAGNATTLVIKGSGFDTDATQGTNQVTLSCGTVQSVTVDSPEQLTVTLAGPLNEGALTATVTTDGVTCANVRVATIVAASTPTVDTSANGFYTNATTVVLYGSGFAPTSGTTPSVTLACASGTIPVGTVTVDSDYQLTISGVDLNNCGGLLTAVVTIDGVSSAETPVATLLNAGTPVIGVPSQTSFWSNATTLIVNGCGFSGEPTVTLTGNYSALGPRPITGFTTTYNTTNQITLSNLSLPYGILEITITDQGSGYTSVPTVTFSGGGATTQATGVAVLDSEGHVTGITLTSPGIGYTSAPTITFSGGGYTTEATAIAAYDTLQSLMVEVIDPINGTSNEPAVANVKAATDNNAPTITSSSINLSSETATLTIKGTNFDAAGTNYVTLYTDGGSTALPVAAIASTATNMGIQNVVANSSGTELTVTLAGPLPPGDLYASVITDGVPMSGSPVQIGTVSPLGITTATTALSQSPSLVVIQGTGFDGNGTNAVTLHTGSSQTEPPFQTQLSASHIASVVADSATQLTVILNSATPLPAGPLAATVVANGVSSGNPVQIAEVVASGPTIEFCSTDLAVTAETLVIQGEDFTGTTSVTLSTVAGAITGAVESFAVHSDGTRITVVLNSSEALPIGQLYATVTTATATSDTVQVATAVAKPVITPNTTRWSTASSLLTLRGSGFSTTAADNGVVLSSGAGVAVRSTSEQIIIRFTEAPTAGPLSAQVTVNGHASESTVVALAVPSVTLSKAHLPITANTLTITGVGFDPTASHNQVALSSGSATVVSATSTQLVVQFVSTPNIGELIATVIVNGERTSAQVATVTATMPWMVRSAANTTIHNRLYTSAWATTEAFDIGQALLMIGGTTRISSIQVLDHRIPVPSGGGGMVNPGGEMVDAERELADIDTDMSTIDETTFVGLETPPSGGSSPAAASIPAITNVNVTAATSADDVKFVWTVHCDEGAGSTELEIDGTTISFSSITSSVSGATITYTYTGPCTAGRHTYIIGAIGPTGVAAKMAGGTFMVMPATPASSDAGATSDDSNTNTIITWSAPDIDSVESSEPTTDAKAMDGSKIGMVMAGSSAVGTVTRRSWRMRRRERNSTGSKTIPFRKAHT